MKMNKTISWEILTAAFLVLFLMVSELAVCKTASAASTSDKLSYKGKVIVLWSGSTAGGGTDVWCRLVARHLGRHISGNPAIVVRTSTAAGGLVAANAVWASKPDGLNMIALGGKVLISNLTRLKGTAYKLEEGYPVYAEPNGSLVCAKPGLFEEAKDIMKAKGLIFGQSAPTSAAAFVFSKELLGFQVEKVIWGFGGDAEAGLALLRDELNITTQSTASYIAGLKGFADKGDVKPIFQLGLLDAKGDIVKEPAAPNVPTVKELYEQIFGKAPSGLAWDTLVNQAGMRTVAKGLVLPPQTPKDLAELVTKAAVEMTKDPKFLEEADKLNPNAPRLAGENLTAGYRLGVSARPEVIQYMKKVFLEKYQVVFE